MLDATVVFVGVGAVGIAAVVGKGPQIPIGSRNFGRHKLPELKLPDPGRVDDVARGGVVAECDQPRGGRGVFALLVFTADAGGAELERGVDAVSSEDLPTPL